MGHHRRFHRECIVILDHQATAAIVTVACIHQANTLPSRKRSLVRRWKKSQGLLLRKKLLPLLHLALTKIHNHLDLRFQARRLHRRQKKQRHHHLVRNEWLVLSL